MDVPLLARRLRRSKDDVRAAFPVLRGGEDAPGSKRADKVQHAPAGSSRVGPASRGGAGPPQPPAAENRPLHAPKGGYSLT